MVTLNLAAADQAVNRLNVPPAAAMVITWPVRAE
jgi:hypothetical protein